MNLENKVSVVIPTLGGQCLVTTIQQLNSGTLIPDEILICIPEEEAYKLVSLDFQNTKVLKTSFRGQVAQRAYGFRHVQNDLVLQLDDDIFMNVDCLERLVRFIQDHRGSAVGPKFIERTTLKYHCYLYKDKNEMSIFDKLSFFILNGSDGFVAASLSKAGLYMGIPDKPNIWIGAGWLPGGCILHRREHLVLENYYPVSGKAFWEDIFHSDLMREKGVLMHRVGEAECTVDFSGDKPTFVKEFFKVLKISKLYVRKNKISSTRITIFYLYNTLILIFRRLF